MAKMEFDLPEDFMKDLLDSDFAEIAEEALMKNIDTVEQSVKKEVSSVIQDKSRSELIDSVKPWKSGIVKTKTNARMLGVSFTGKPKKGGTHQRSDRKNASELTNNDIAWWLEKGNAHQPARPYIDRATKNIEQKVMNSMQDVYNKKVGIK